MLVTPSDAAHVCARMRFPPSSHSNWMPIDSSSGKHIRRISPHEYSINVIVDRLASLFPVVLRESAPDLA